ncbi:MAG TPA: hypothetical protein DHV94_06795 [Clostridiales bacterium]|nr:hypothetical protein [Clostridiales bacterium]HCJ89100.1 hypothetical protein [Clostridiales bacterium]
MAAHPCQVNSILRNPINLQRNRRLGSRRRRRGGRRRGQIVQHLLRAGIIQILQLFQLFARIRIFSLNNQINRVRIHSIFNCRYALRCIRFSKARFVSCNRFLIVSHVFFFASLQVTFQFIDCEQRRIDTTAVKKCCLEIVLQQFQCTHILSCVHKFLAFNFHQYVAVDLYCFFRRAAAGFLQFGKALSQYVCILGYFCFIFYTVHVANVFFQLTLNLFQFRARFLVRQGGYGGHGRHQQHDAQ